MAGYDSNQLKQVLIDKGGYNPTDAENAANNKGGNADSLAREFLGYNPNQASVDTPQNSSDFGGYLKSYQDSLNKLIDSPQVKVPTVEELRASVAPSTPAPAPINRVDMFNTLRQDQGIKTLEDNLSTLDQDAMNLEDQYRKLAIGEKDKPVALNVIEGRVTEEQRQLGEKLTVINNQRTKIANQLNTKYNIVSTIVNYAGMDYKDAVDRYETEFNSNLKVQGLFLDYVKLSDQQTNDKIANITKAAGLTMDAAKLEMAQREQDQTIARANLTTVMNAISSGSTNFNSLDAGTKATIAKLEAQAGLPIGFTSSIGLSAKDKVLFNHSNNGVTQVGYIDQSGNVQVKSYGSSTSGGSTAQSVTVGGIKYTAKEWQSKVSQAINVIKNIDKNYVTNGDKLETNFMKEGDNVLSKLEADRALQETISKFGGNVEMGNKAFVEAWEAGGFQRWNP